MLTTSPVTIPSPRSGRAPSATTASPVVTAARTAISSPSSRSSSIVSRILNAERTARSASSSCATGAPKTAMTASPMNFSTVPPKRSMSALTRSWYGRSVARTSSGSARSERLVNPTRSTKSTETTLLSSPAVALARAGYRTPGRSALARGSPRRRRADDHARIFAAGAPRDTRCRRAAASRPRPPQAAAGGRFGTTRR